MKEHLTTWLIVAFTILSCLLVLGRSIKDNALGILVDSRNKMSLSRMQMVLWITLLVSAFVTAALTHETSPDVTQWTARIYIAPDVWALMGITIGSVTGSVIVKANKSAQTPMDDGTAQHSEREKRKGVLRIAEAPSFGDMFKGEELVDDDYIDIAKVQMFFFTLALVATYAAALYDANLTAPDIPLEGDQTYDVYFPTLSAGMVTLLGISHAGYLSVKATPSTPVQR